MEKNIHTQNKKNITLPAYKGDFELVDNIRMSTDRDIRAGEPVFGLYVKHTDGGYEFVGIISALPCQKHCDNLLLKYKWEFMGFSIKHHSYNIIKNYPMKRYMVGVMAAGYLSLRNTSTLKIKPIEYYVYSKNKVCHVFYRNSCGRHVPKLEKWDYKTHHNRLILSTQQANKNKYFGAQTLIY
jgi:hypothetical protein